MIFFGLTFIFLFKNSYELECYNSIGIKFPCMEHQNLCYIFNWANFITNHIPISGCASTDPSAMDNCVTCSIGIQYLSDLTCSGTATEGTANGTICCCAENLCNTDFNLCKLQTNNSSRIIKMKNYSIVSLCHIFVGQPPCVYCKSEKKSKSTFRLNVKKLLPEHFNGLVDRGWIRESWESEGKEIHQIYKFIQEESCCPGYGHRLNVHEFRLSRSQKRVITNIGKFLRTGRKTLAKFFTDINTLNLKNIEEKENQEICTIKSQKICEEKNSFKTSKNKCCTEKKKFIRKQRKLATLKNRGVDIEQYQKERQEKEVSRRITLKERLKNVIENENMHKLEILHVFPNTNQFFETLEEMYQIFAKYQKERHNLTDTQRMFYFDHGITPFKDYTSNPRTIFMQYLLDGKIIAVGIVDVLTQYFSSKYFFYDPEYAFLNLGTFSVLNEIALTKQLAKDLPELQYYTMGAFVQTTKKLRYKINFKPSEILCEHSMQWVPLTNSIEQKLLSTKHDFLSFKKEFQPENWQEIDDLLCIFNGAICTYGTLKENLRNREIYDKLLNLYVKYMGSLSPHFLIRL